MRVVRSRHGDQWFVMQGNFIVKVFYNKLDAEVWICENKNTTSKS